MNQAPRGTVYLAGPMRGCADFNRPAFHAAARRWRDLGFVVMNPAENDLVLGDDRPFADYFRNDLVMLSHMTALVLLTGWVASRGARIEARIALALGVPCYDASTGAEITATVKEVLRDDQV